MSRRRRRRRRRQVGIDDRSVGRTKNIARNAGSGPSPRGAALKNNNNNNKIRPMFLTAMNTNPHDLSRPFIRGHALPFWTEGCSRTQNSSLQR